MLHLTHRKETGQKLRNAMNLALSNTRAAAVAISGHIVKTGTPDLL